MVFLDVQPVSGNIQFTSMSHLRRLKIETIYQTNIYKKPFIAQDRARFYIYFYTRQHFSYQDVFYQKAQTGYLLIASTRKCGEIEF